MSLFARRFLPLILTLATSVVGCGASKPVGAKPARSEGNQTEIESQESTRESKEPDCGDGTCFPCGKAICLPGFFCDESTAQPNCQFSAKCGNAANCACVNELLGSGCRCTERSGGVFVKCSS